MDMMAYLVLLIGIWLPVVLAATFLLLRHWHRRQYFSRQLSSVTRQHIDLFQGGQLSQAAVESAKSQFRVLLERGQAETVEASLRPGTNYIIQVRALAEIGTDDAGRILERQLQRRLTPNQIEQSWYWIDLASSLRSLNREQSLPHLLRCAEAASELPLGHLFAAETVCFLGFGSYLRPIGSPLGGAALRILHQALEGLRYGVPPQIVAEARLGEVVESLWDNRPEAVHPLVVRVFAEALRLLRRAPHGEAALANEISEQEAFHWQISRIAVLEPALEDYLQEAPRHLCGQLTGASSSDQRDILQALADLRAEAAAVVLPLLSEPDFAHADLAVEVLTWSHDFRVGPWLCAWAERQVPMQRRAGRRRADPPLRPSLPADFPYQAILRALRGHPSPATESFLCLAARDWDPTFRAAAISSLGWWEPVLSRQVLATLHQGRHDRNGEVRQAARAALARLGERQALQWFRHALVCDEPLRVHETLQAIASEGLTLLWPDLDRLAEAEDMDVANHAREALERLGENLDHRPA